MALVHAYATVAQLKDELGVLDDLLDDAKLERSLNSASRQIDDHCGPGRRFWKDATVKVRTFHAYSSRLVEIPVGIASTAGLVVKVDDGDDGTFSTPLTINTEFLLRPDNAAAEYPVRPWDEIVLLNGVFPRYPSGRPGVQVTALFGWPAVPEVVEKACLLQAALLYKSKDTPFDTAGGVELGTVRRTSQLHPVAAGLLGALAGPSVG